MRWPSPRRGIGPATDTRVITWTRDRHGGDLIAAAAHADELDHLPSEAARQRLVEFGAGLSHVRSELEAGRSLGHVVIATVTLAGGLVRHYKPLRDHSPNHERRADAERVLEFTLAPGLEWTILCYLDLETMQAQAGQESAPTVVDFKVPASSGRTRPTRTRKPASTWPRDGLRAIQPMSCCSRRLPSPARDAGS
jgi:hypothetical protein